ncbi:MAG: hypothetical protein QXY45_01365 [Candidatus Aenigmatarchaeota archaeon]
MIFCDKCSSVMLLKEKKGGNEGKYECLRCGLVKTTKIKKIELRETSFEERLPEIEELKVPIYY